MNLLECNTGEVIIGLNRYDELLHKEQQLNTIKRLYDELSDYSFRDVVGHLFKTTVKADE